MYKLQNLPCMKESGSGQLCERCRKVAAREIICSECISELLEAHDHKIGWRMALEIEREEREGKNLSIQIQ